MGFNFGFGSGKSATPIIDGIQILPRTSAAPVVSSGSVLGWERTQPWTVICKMQVAQKPAAAGIFFTTCSQGANGPNYPGFEFWPGPNGNCIVRIINSILSNYIEVDSSINVCDGNPHYVAASYDGGSKAAGVKIYVDGALDTGATVAKDTLTSSIISAAPLLIGNQLGYTYSLGGTISEFMLSNVVRSASWIANYKTASSNVDSNTIRAFPFSEQAGYFTKDLSSNNVPAFVNNVSWLNGTAIQHNGAVSPSYGSGARTTAVVTLPRSVASGGSVCGYFALAAASNANFTVTDNKGNSYTVVTNNQMSGVIAGKFYALNLTNNPSIITITIGSGTGTFWFACADEIDGVTGLDGSALAYNASVSGANGLSSGSITTTQPNDLIVGYTAQFSGVAVNTGSGFYGLEAYADANSNMYSEFLTQAAAGPIAATFSPSATAQGHAAIFAFKNGAIA